MTTAQSSAWKRKQKSYAATFVLDENFQTQDLDTKEEFSPPSGIATTMSSDSTSVDADSTHSSSHCKAHASTAVVQATQGNQNLPRHTLSATYKVHLDYDDDEVMVSSHAADNVVSSNVVQAEGTTASSFDWKWVMIFNTHKLTQETVIDKSVAMVLVAFVGDGDELDEPASVICTWIPADDKWVILYNYTDSQGTVQNDSRSVSGWELNESFDHHATDVPDEKTITMTAYIGKLDLSDGTAYRNGDYRAKEAEGTFVDVTEYGLRSIVELHCVSLEDHQ